MHKKKICEFYKLASFTKEEIYFPSFSSMKCRQNVDKSPKKTRKFIKKLIRTEKIK